MQEAVAGDVLHLAAKALQACAAVAAGRDAILQTGVAVLVVDLLHMSLSHLEQWRQSKLYTPTPTPTPTPTSTHPSTHTPAGESVSNTNSSPSKTPVVHTWPSEALFVPPLLSVVSMMMRHLPQKSPSLPSLPSSLPSSLSSEETALFDWVWHFFASGVLGPTCHSLLQLQQLTSEVTEQELPYTFTLGLMSLVGGVASFLRTSAGVTVSTLVVSTSQLSSKKHAHSRGREMVGLLRSAEVASSLIAFLSNLLLEGAQNRRHKTARGAGQAAEADCLSATVYTLSLSVLEALMELATVDISLIQRLPSDLQMSVAHSAHRMLGSLVHGFDQASDADGSGGVSCALSACLVIGSDGSTVDANTRTSSNSTTTTTKTTNTKTTTTNGTTSTKSSSSSSVSSSSSKVTKTAAFSGADRRHCLDVLLGFLCVACLDNPKMQSFVGHGPVPTLLIDLLRLPAPFFANPVLKRQLFPTLVAACVGCEANLQVLRTEVSDEFLLGFLKEALQQVEALGGVGVGVGVGGNVSLCLLSHRLPVDLWRRGLEEISRTSSSHEHTHTDILTITLPDSEFYK